MFSLVQIVLASVLVVACNATLNPDNPDVQACFKENGLDVEKLKEWKSHPAGQMPHPKFKCAVKCLMEKDGELKPDGTLDFDKIEARLKEATGRIPPEKIPEMMECAKKVDKISTCEDMEQLRECHHLLRHD